MNAHGTDYQHFCEALDLFHEYHDLLAADAKTLNPEQFPASVEIFAGLLKARQDREDELRRQFAGTETRSLDVVQEIVWHSSKDDDDGHAIELFAYRTDAENPVCFEKADKVWRSRAVGEKDCPAVVNVLRASLNRETGATEIASPSKQDLAYRIPGRATLRVWGSDVDGKEFDLFRKTYDVAQFGVVAHLPKKLGSSSSYDVTLDSLTGALRPITVGSKGPINGDLLKQAAGVNTSVLGALDAAKRPTPLEATQKKRDLKAKQLQIKLIDGCNSDPTQAYCTSILPTLFK